MASLAVSCGLPSAGLAGGGDDDNDSDEPTGTATSSSCYETACPTSTPVCYGQNGGEGPSCVASVTFAPCAASTDCPGPDAVCYGLASGNPQGLCSRPQSYAENYAASGRTFDPSLCGAGAAPGDEDSGTVYVTNFGSLGGHVCAPSCSDEVSSCPRGFACAVTGAAAADAGPILGCVADCEDDSDCPASGCNLYTHHCGALDTTLQDDGQVCQLDADCRSGWCEPPSAGFLDGLCVSKCLAPAASAYVGAPLPQAGCPANEVCPPPPAGTGALSQCRPPCTTSADCRPDYVCHLVPGAIAGGEDGGDGGVAGFCGIRVDPLAPTN